MSLSVWLETEKKTVKCSCEFCGHCHEHAVSDTVYSGNITSNLYDMAEALGLADALWKPRSCGINKAYQLSSILLDGIKKLESSPQKFREYEAKNKWGTVEGLLEFLRGYYSACVEFKESNIFTD